MSQTDQVEFRPRYINISGDPFRFQPLYFPHLWRPPHLHPSNLTGIVRGTMSRQIRLKQKRTRSYVH